MRRDRSLEKHSVDAVIRIQFRDKVKQSFLVRVRGKKVLFRIDTDLRARFLLVVDIYFRCGIVADKYNGKSGYYSFVFQFRDLFRDVLFNLLRKRFPFFLPLRFFLLPFRKPFRSPSLLQRSHRRSTRPHCRRPLRSRCCVSLSSSSSRRSFQKRLCAQE